MAVAGIEVAAAAGGGGMEMYCWPLPLNEEEAQEVWTLDESMDDVVTVVASVGEGSDDTALHATTTTI